MFKMIEVKGPALCRYGWSCPHGKHGNPIPKGDRILCISVHSAGGGASAYYCKKHTQTVLREMKELLDAEASIENGTE